MWGWLMVEVTLEWRHRWLLRKQTKMENAWTGQLPTFNYIFGPLSMREVQIISKRSDNLPYVWWLLFRLPKLGELPSFSNRLTLHFLNPIKWWHPFCPRKQLLVCITSLNHYYYNNINFFFEISMWMWRILLINVPRSKNCFLYVTCHLKVFNN